MSIYDIDFNTQVDEITPPDKRKPRILSFLYALVYPIQIIRDLFYTEYADGFTGVKWDALSSFNPGDRVRYDDRSVYECIVFSGPGVLPTNTNFWVKIQEDYVGVRERQKYNSRKLLFEFILNKWFEVAIPPAPQIYIQNNNTYGTAFLLGETGPYSSKMANNSAYQVNYLGSAYTFNQNNFTIFVPAAVFAAIDANPVIAEGIVRSVADKYVIAGMIYDVQTY